MSEFFEFVGAIIMIDHGPKLRVVLNHLLVFTDFSIAYFNNFEGLHVEVVFEREVDVHFTCADE